MKKSAFMRKRTTATKSHQPKPMLAEDNHLGLERLVFFSDAVFAIAITLLALEIRLPITAEHLTNAELLQALQSIGSSYLSYVLSFLVIGIFWIGHHRRFSFIEHYDSGLLLLNMLLLMGVAFIPFPTSVISEYGNQTATIFYAAVMSAIGLTSSLIWWYASSRRLISPNLDTHTIRRETLRGLTIPTIFLLSIALAFINDDLAKLFWLLLLPAWLFMR